MWALICVFVHVGFFAVPFLVLFWHLALDYGGYISSKGEVCGCWEVLCEGTHETASVHPEGIAILLQSPVEQIMSTLTTRWLVQQPLRPKA
jgi:hypothetical protein